MRTEILEMLRKEKLIVIIRGLSSSVIRDLAGSLVAGGAKMVEVTFNQLRPETWQETTKAISLISKEFSRELLVGAGTVLSVEQIKLAHDAGSKFIISPNVDTEVIRETRNLGMCSFPGAFTPSEIVAAHNAGADAVKLFPASTLGLDYIKAIKAPLPHIPMMAVGGVNELNTASFIAAGMVGVGVGSNIVKKSLIEAEDWRGISTLCEAYVKAIKAHE